ncbi:MAG: hypothetical protein GY909_02235 [Oligoflexia bacterium]|nr:hypothetical protein [Oligoflexia bacterium]
MKSVLIFILLLSNIAWAKTSFKKQVDVIESNILSEIKKHKITKKREYYLYLLASREYMQINYSEKAKEYLNKALELDVDINKFEVLVNLISLNWLDKEKVKNYYPQLLKEYKSGGKKLMRFDPYISGVKSYIDGEKLDKNHPWNKTVYGYSFIEENHNRLIEEKKFKEALAQLNPNGRSETDAMFDLLQTHVFGHAKKPSTCSKMLKKYPKASGYTAQICRVVLAYHSKDKKKLKVAKEKAISVIKDRKKYNKKHMIVAVKELQL